VTKEIKLSPEKYQDLAGLLYNNDPQIKSINPIVQQHLTDVHHFTEIPTFPRLYAQIEHLDAVLSKRRAIEELLPKTK